MKILLLIIIFKVVEFPTYVDLIYYPLLNRFNPRKFNSSVN